MLFADIAIATSDHNRLVVAAALAVKIHFKGSQVTADIGSAKFVVKGGATNRPFNHNIQRRDNSLRLAIIPFPGLAVVGNIEVGDTEAHQAHLGLGAAAHSALVTNLATRAGTGTRVGRDRCGVVVGFHLHQHMHRLLAVAVELGGRIRVEAPAFRANHNSGVVRVGGEDILSIDLVGVANHAKQGVLLVFSIQGPAGIKNFVSAVFRVGLGKHHQLNIGGVALKLFKACYQIVDLIIGKGKAQFHIGSFQRLFTATENIDAGEWCRLLLTKQNFGLLQVVEHRFNHAVMEFCGHLSQLGLTEIFLSIDVVGDPPLHPVNLAEAAVVGNIGGLAGPG